MKKILGLLLALLLGTVAQAGTVNLLPMNPTDTVAGGCIGASALDSNVTIPFPAKRLYYTVNCTGGVLNCSLFINTSATPFVSCSAPCSLVGSGTLLGFSPVVTNQDQVGTTVQCSGSDATNTSNNLRITSGVPHYVINGGF